jgi:hypothetical protein
LQTGNEMICLSRALSQVFDLVVFNRDFGTEKTNLAVFLIEPLFELLNIAECAGACSGLLRMIFLVGHHGACGSRRERVGTLLLRIPLVIFAERGGTCGSLLRRVPNVMSLFQECDKLVGGRGLDKILKTIGSIFLFATERTDTAIALDTLGMAWKAGNPEPSFRLSDRNRIIEMFRCVGIGGSLFRHVLMIPRRDARRAVYPQNARGIHPITTSPETLLFIANFALLATIILMASKTHAFDKRGKIVVPVVSLEEVPQLTDAERTQLVSELEQTEKAMEAGAFQSYSPEWLRQRFLKIFAPSHK